MTIEHLVASAGFGNHGGDDGSVSGWRARGWHHLHPIIPAMELDELRLKAWADAKGWTEKHVRSVAARMYGGKAPGALKPGGYWFGLNVQKPGAHEDPDLADAFGRAWTVGDKKGLKAGVGVIGLEFPCVDVDVTDPGRAAAVRALLSRVFGPEGQAWFRVGKAPKFAMPFRWAPTTSARCDKLVLPVIGGERIEVIGVGYQWVLDGVHGGTRRPYSWEGPEGPGRPRVDQLPVLDRKGLLDLLDALAATVGTGRPGRAGEARGGWIGEVVLEHRANTRDRPSHYSYERAFSLQGPEPLVRRLVAAIPNGLDQNLSYEVYVAMLHAIKGASGGEGWGLDAWMGWCAQWPHDRPEVNLDKWAGLATGSVRKLGFDWLERRANLRLGEKARIAIDAAGWRMEQRQQAHAKGGIAA